ncbi:helix-turn-helix domain-containing protein [Daejeonella sp.]|uniref:helix-turn-helix domain-containing protein n=1 Tax=Daejeonella sp. TaxID=2805397 RepID=UPI00398326F8
MVVELELERLGFLCRSIEIGCADIIGEVTSEDLLKIKTALHKSGLELVDSKKGILVDKIKSAVIDKIQGSKEHLRGRFSDYLAIKLDYDYTYLANVFSEMESTTIAQFIIVTRVEAAKDLLTNSELSLTEISWKLNYSSVAHLSTQFKKITGFTPSHFRQTTDQALENV